jgi:repressor of nif and glnA expression
LSALEVLRRGKGWLTKVAPTATRQAFEIARMSEKDLKKKLFQGII